MLELIEKGAVKSLVKAGAGIRSAFCGPCFVAGDVPFNNALSIRHVTRNFPYREGAQPADGQMAAVALMDARSIAATAVRNGILTPAAEFDSEVKNLEYHFDRSVYDSRIYFGWEKAQDIKLAYGPNIVDWPPLPELPQHLLLQVVSFITDPVTTTDELIPSGETSSFRSNPLRLAEFTLSRKDPGYVAKTKMILAMQQKQIKGEKIPELLYIWERILALPGTGALSEPNGIDVRVIGIGSCIYAHKPGDGSAREQAASCQRVLGGAANIALEYATKRYRSNLLNWGMLPLLIDSEPSFCEGDFIYIPHVRNAVSSGTSNLTAWVLSSKPVSINFQIGELSEDERKVLLAGCLINYYRDTE
jgi:aconitate hydratase